MAMARDGLLPSFFSDVNKRSHVPVKSTLATPFCCSLSISHGCLSAGRDGCDILRRWKQTTLNFGEMVACFCYASIDLHSAYLPPPKLEFNYDNQDWLQKDEVEIGNYDSFYEKGMIFTPDQILGLTKETRRLLPSSVLSSFVPHTLDLPVRL
ncbi:hypothetical protein K1719_020243 [Acacia pycnantha]|nr:hypothetical protein K1719_020243 [Acacia pycnantha]